MPPPDRPADDASRHPTGAGPRYVPVPGVVDLDAHMGDDSPLPDAPDAPVDLAPVDDGPFGEPDSPFAEPAPPSTVSDPLPMADPPRPAVDPLPADVPDPSPEPEPTVEPAVEPAGPEPAGPAASSPPAALAIDPPGLDLGSARPPAAAATVPPAIVESAKEATRSRGREFVALVVRYGRAHLPAPAPRAVTPDAGPPRLAGRLGTILPFLRLIPWVLGVLFAASFVWDTESGLMRVLTVSGLIGFLTNWLAITMLFQPREKRAIIPQGLIPAQRERVIYRLSEAISRELINADIIKARIQESGVIGRYRDLALGVVRGVVEDPDFRTDLKALAQEYATEVLGSESLRREMAALAVQKVEEQAGQGFGGVALRLYRTFAEDDFQRRVDRALAELPQAITPLLDRVDAALDAVPAKVEARADEIEDVATRAVLSFVEGFDVRAMIADKARTFDEAQLEGLLKSTSNEQLNYIQYLGGILGVVGGLVIWRPVEALAGFVAVGLALWGLDEALVRMRHRREDG